MKINIAGKGIIPGMGILPPVYNIEKSESDIRRLTNFTNIRVYCSENGLLITKKNVDTFFKTKPTTTKNVGVKPKTVDGLKRNVLIEQEQQHQKKQKKEETPVVIEEAPIETIIEETITTEEDVVGVDEIESVVEETDEEEVVTTEEETESKQQTYSSKKKNKNKNRR